VETSDAGELFDSAQTTIGIGSIDEITGAISTSYDVDLYKIRISDPTNFSAYVSGGEGSNNWDSVLTLFDENGLGIYRNDDVETSSGNAGLPANHLLGPKIAGNYFLAISDDDIFPYGSAPINESIYSFFSYPYTQVIGPTDSDLTLASWNSMSTEHTFNNANYSISFTGAEFAAPVPVPTATWLFGSGIIGFLGMRKKAL
jgi:hypothetical protein